MKRTAETFRFVLVAIACCCAPALPAASVNAESASELAALEQFLGLSDAQLDQLMAALARVRAMSAEERAAFAAEIRAYRGLPGEQRRQIRDGWGRQGAESRDDWRRMMLALDPEARARVQAELQSLPPDERVRRRLEMLEDWKVGAMGAVEETP